MAADVKLLPLPELPRQVEGYNSDYWEAGQIEEYAADVDSAVTFCGTTPMPGGTGPLDEVEET